MTEKEGCYLTR